MLELRNITIRFGGLVAVNNVSLKIKNNEILGLVGPNGAGKTTLFNVISGLVKPSGGQIYFKDKNMKRTSQFMRARLGIGRSFQIPQPFHGLTVRENLIIAQRFGAGKINSLIVDNILDFLDLSNRADAQADTDLALRELKALELAKALATEPKILLLDEVLAGLETNGKRRFLNLLKEIQEKYQIGILIIEHDIETIGNLCDRVCVLNFGEMIAEGIPEVVFADPEVIRSYIGDAQ